MPLGFALSIFPVLLCLCYAKAEDPLPGRFTCLLLYKKGGMLYFHRRTGTMHMMVGWTLEAARAGGRGQGGEEVLVEEGAAARCDAGTRSISNKSILKTDFFVGGY